MDNSITLNIIPLILEIVRIRWLNSVQNVEQVYKMYPYCLIELVNCDIFITIHYAFIVNKLILKMLLIKCKQSFLQFILYEVHWRSKVWDF